jgi:hypothetical protein
MYGDWAVKLAHVALLFEFWAKAGFRALEANTI